MSTRTLIAVTVSALALLSPELAGQAPAGCSPAGNVQFICGQDGPEDLVVVPGSEWVVASIFSGSGGIRLISVRDLTSTVAYPTASSREQLDAKTYDSCPGAPDAAEKASFRTHGLAIRPGRNSGTRCTPSTTASGNLLRSSSWTRVSSRRCSHGSDAPWRRIRLA